MGSAIGGTNRVRVRKDVFVVVLVAPLESRFHLDIARIIGEIDDLADRIFVLIKRGHVFT